jgi:hypothetical protein
MSVTIAVNFLTPSHGGSNGTSMAFPDVCKTPTPAGPVPIPYPNIAMSKDIGDGSSAVKFDGKPVMLKSSCMSMSTGDEAGSAMGVVSNKIKGKATFVNYSFDVKVEGSNVCRLSDPTQQNKGSGNAFGPAHLQPPTIVLGAQVKECEKIRKKQKEQGKKGRDSKWSKSGIVAPHRPVIQSVSTSLQVIFYFRATNLACEKWILGFHKPKPHEVIEAKSIADGPKGNVADAEHWLGVYFAYRRDSVRSPRDLAAFQAFQKSQGIRKLPVYVDGVPASAYTGIIMDLRSNRKGMPMQAYGKDFRRKKYVNKWITGDYDLMDVVNVGDSCERPAQDGPSFARIQSEINNKLKWDAIQHGPQSQWVAVSEAEGGHDYASFSIPKLLKSYLSDPTAKEPPRVPISPSRTLPACDNNLTVVAPGKCVVHLESDEDVKSAMLCLGCHKEGAGNLVDEKKK